MSLWDNAKNAALIEKMMRFQLRERVLALDLDTIKFLLEKSETHPHVGLMNESRLRNTASHMYTRPTLLAFGLWVLDDLPLYFKMSKAELAALRKIAPANSEAAHCIYLARMYARVCHREGLLRGK